MAGTSISPSQQGITYESTAQQALPLPQPPVSQPRTALSQEVAYATPQPTPGKQGQALRTLGIPPLTPLSAASQLQVPNSASSMSQEESRLPVSQPTQVQTRSSSQAMAPWQPPTNR